MGGPRIEPWGIPEGTGMDSYEILRYITAMTI